MEVLSLAVAFLASAIYTGALTWYHVSAPSYPAPVGGEAEWLAGLNQAGQATLAAHLARVFAEEWAANLSGGFTPGEELFMAAYREASKRS